MHFSRKAFASFCLMVSGDFSKLELSSKASALGLYFHLISALFQLHFARVDSK